MYVKPGLMLINSRKYKRTHICRENHTAHKVAVALQGQPIKDFVLKRTLTGMQEQQALKKLEDFLKPRIHAVKKGEVSKKISGYNF